MTAPVPPCPPGDYTATDKSKPTRFSPAGPIQATLIVGSPIPPDGRIGDKSVLAPQMAGIPDFHPIIIHPQINRLFRPSHNQNSVIACIFDFPLKKPRNKNLRKSLSGGFGTTQPG